MSNTCEEINKIKKYRSCYENLLSLYLNSKKKFLNKTNVFQKLFDSVISD